MAVITVIVPVYNTAAYLPACLESIRAQTHANLEILLIDDGSTDGSGEICNAFARRDCRFRVIHQENRGLSAARNAGLDAAQGQYISFVDSDDEIVPEMLEILLRELEKAGADMALCNLRRLPGGDTPMAPGVLNTAEFLERLLGEEAWYYVTVPNKLYTRALWRDLRFPEGYIHEDEAVIYELAARCRRIAIAAPALYFYRVRPGSITAGADIRHSDKLLAIARRNEFCRENRWQRGLDANCKRFTHTFWDFYMTFERNEKNLPYFRRMEAQLARVLPELLRSRAVSLRHKLYLIIIRLHPGLFFFLRNRKRRKTP